MSNYSFSRYESFNSRTSEKTWSITRNYAIGISAAFWNEYKINRYKSVVLYWDAKLKSIGVRFVTKEEPSRFALTYKENSAGGSIICRSFFKKQDISIEQYAGKKYLPKRLSLSTDLGIDEPGDMFVIDLEDPVG